MRQEAVGCLCGRETAQERQHTPRGNPAKEQSESRKLQRWVKNFYKSIYIKKEEKEEENQLQKILQTISKVSSADWNASLLRFNWDSFGEKRFLY